MPMFNQSLWPESWEAGEWGTRVRGAGVGCTVQAQVGNNANKNGV